MQRIKWKKFSTLTTTSLQHLDIHFDTYTICYMNGIQGSPLLHTRVISVIHDEPKFWNGNFFSQNIILLYKIRSMLTVYNSTSGLIIWWDFVIIISWHTTIWGQARVLVHNVHPSFQPSVCHMRISLKLSKIDLWLPWNSTRTLRFPFQNLPPHSPFCAFPGECSSQRHDYLSTQNYVTGVLWSTL